MKHPVALAPDTIRSQAYETDIILLDLIAYSLLPDDQQYRAIYYLNKTIRAVSRALELGSYVRGERIVQGFLPAGDGSYLILNPRISGYGPLFALLVRNLLLHNSRLLDNLYAGVRISVHHGTVIPIDFLASANYVGDGLNVCARLLTRTVYRKARGFYPDDNLVVVSAPAWEAFHALFPPRQRAVRDYLRRIQFVHSRPYTVHDKHRDRPPYRVRFIDGAREVGTAPPRPRGLAASTVAPPTRLA